MGVDLPARDTFQQMHDFIQPFRVLKQTVVDGIRFHLDDFDINLHVVHHLAGFGEMDFSLKKLLGITEAFEKKK